MITKSTLKHGSLTEETPTLERRTKHAELTEQLRGLVTDLRPGDRLPAQDELMRRYKVSDRTVLRSLEDLQRAGWIVRRPRSGTYVTDPSERELLTAGSPLASPPAKLPTQSRIVSVLAPHFFAASYLRLCADLLAVKAEEAGLSLMCHVARSYSDPDDLPAIEAMNPRGFILLGYPLAHIAASLIQRGHRAVVIGTPPLDVAPDVPCVFADHEQGGYIAANHLLDLGHRRLGFAFDSQMRYPHERHPRWLGHQRALTEARLRLGLNAEEITTTVLDQDTLQAWRNDSASVAEYFRRADAATGIAAWNDSVAISMLGVLHRAGLRVPDDVSIIGFDALPEGADSIPPLTTVDQHVGWQVQAALRLLSRPAPPPPQAVVTIPELKQRSSCAAPRLPKTDS